MRGWAYASVTATALCFGQAALAADMPVKAVAPVSAPVFNWTGFYVGLNVGGSWSDNNISYRSPFTGPGNVFAVCAAPPGGTLPAPTTGNLFARCASDDSSFLIGGQIGYNWQMGALVLGIEGDLMWRDHDARQFVRFGNNPTGGAPMGSVVDDTAYLTHEQGSLGTLRARLGYAPGPWLLYVTGGLAVGKVESSVIEVLFPGNTCVAFGATCRGASDSETKVGYAVGAGFAYALNMNWSLGAEYLFVDLGNSTLTLVPTVGVFTNTSVSTFKNESHLARAKLNYRFTPR